MPQPEMAEPTMPEPTMLEPSMPDPSMPDPSMPVPSMPAPEPTPEPPNRCASDVDCTAMPSYCMTSVLITPNAQCNLVRGECEETTEICTGNTPRCVDDGSGGVCAPPPPESDATGTCDNGNDDDFDGLTDCEDDGCQNSPQCTGFRNIAAGRRNTCATTSDGSILCWGEQNSIAQYPVADIHNFTQIQIDEDHGCALDVAINPNNNRPLEKIVCWGDDDGDGFVSETNQIPSPLLAIGVGKQYSCGIFRPTNQTTGPTYCYGEHGRNRADRVVTSPTAQDVASANENTYIVTQQGDIYCWGNDFGDSPQADCGFPTQQNYLRIAAGSGGNDRVCAWGLTNWACNGIRDVSGTAPSLTTGFKELAVGESHVCGLLPGGDVVCWGETISIDPRLNPPSGITFSTISATHKHTCGITADKQMIYCWGCETDGNIPSSACETRRYAP